MSNSIQEDLFSLANICHANLRNSKECLTYLRDRGLTKELVKANKLGYFPQNVSILKKFISETNLTKLNLARFSGGSDFSNYFYLTFPIFSEYGDVVGISGRTLLSESDRRVVGIPKYKNSSYKKSDILYGLDKAKASILKRKNVYVLEGYFDYLSMVKNNIDNCVAICGTAFSKKHFLKLARYTEKITFILDSDDAGVTSANRIYTKFINKGIKLRFLSLPNPYKDIDEYLSSGNKSRETFQKELKQRIPELW